jgi:hypothetical protein
VKKPSKIAQDKTLGQGEGLDMGGDDKGGALFQRLIQPGPGGGKQGLFTRDNGPIFPKGLSSIFGLLIQQSKLFPF